MITSHHPVVTAVTSWLDTPYHHQARVKGVGVDCAQLVAAVAEECGYIKPGIVIQNYSPEWHLHNREERMVNIVLEFGCLEKTGELEPGDILAFKFGRVCSHLGIYVGNEQFVHARIDQGKVVLNTLSGDWKQRHLRTFTFPKEQIR